MCGPGSEHRGLDKARLTKIFMSSPESKTDYEVLRSHSAMLGQIAALVEDYCTPEMTTLEGVQAMKAELDSESRWADHYCRRLVEAQRAGYLPDGFKF